MNHRKQRVAETQTAAIALCASAVWTGAHGAGPPLPVTCAAAACGRTGPTQWVTGGAATLTTAPNALTINQSTNSAILNWSSFNIAAGNSVTFQQPSSSAVALNRIFQQSPSQIFGQLSANGQIYLLNQNGFLFGAGSTINVGSLLASSLPLNLTDADIINGAGILSPLKKSQATFDAHLDTLAPGGRTVVLDSEGGQVLDSQGRPIPVQILIEPGAQINAAAQGRVLLAGQKVTNGGTITAPDGQIVLAAGARIFLQASTDPNLRGLIVEVDKLDTEDKTENTAWNQLTGTLSAPRGNITMVGLAVNQEGRISATTSVAANGSIRLEAAGASSPSADKLASQYGGTLTIGPQSEMDILPELSSSDTAVVADKQPVSSVTLMGEQVFLQGGSIVAPGGTLQAVAASDPSRASLDPTALSTPDANARLRIDPSVSIDLSGSKATLPVSANLIPVQLRSAELADDPAQRDGPLHGQTVYVDARTAKSSTFANFAGDVDAVPMNVAQRTEQGGTATFLSSGDLVFSSGASVNVSGGSTTYTGGAMQTSYLIGTNGKLYPIQTADPLMSYVGVLNPTFSQTYNKWGVKDVLPTPGLSSYQPGYLQGAAAGKVQFAATSMVLQGKLQGTAVNGLYQRTPTTAVSGGQLLIGLQNGAPSAVNPLALDYVAPAVQFTRNSVPIVASDDSSLPNPLTLYLPTSYLTDTGFTSTQINSNYDVTLPEGPALNLPSGSTLTVNAARVNILSDITDAGGTLSFQSVYNVGSISTTSVRPGVSVGDGVILDVSGSWTNDMPMAGGPRSTQTWQNGGTIDLGTASPGALLSVGNEVSLLANGGAWLNAKASLTGGTGGSIGIHADELQDGLRIGDRLVLAAFGVQGAQGGKFNFAAPRIEISNADGAWADAQTVDDNAEPGGVFNLHSSLFSDYGFQTFKLNASGLVVAGAADKTLLSVASGTSVEATVSTLYVSSKAFLAPSAARIDGLTSKVLQQEYFRPAANITLSALPKTVLAPQVSVGNTPAGDVVVSSGASIETDAGGSINLMGINSLIVDGQLRAPGGQVSLRIFSPVTPGTNDAYRAFEAGFLPDQRIGIGAAGVIDVSGKFVSKPSTSPYPLNLGTLYSGGTVSLLADRGAVVAEHGSLISVAGATAPFDVLQANGLYGHQVGSSAGGSITARSAESIFLAGDIHAAAGAGGTSGPAAAGSLDIELTRSQSWWGAVSTEAANSFNQAPMTVQLLPQKPIIVGLPTLLFGSNQAVLGVTDLSQWGLDSLRIEAGNSLTLSGNFSLALNRSITLDSPVIYTAAGAQASLSAPYLEVNYLPGNTAAANANSPTAGTGSVHFAGSEIDLVGNTVFQGTSDVVFSSSGDLLLRGQTASVPTGGIAVAGNLTLNAARIYPVTGTNFAIDVADPSAGVDGVLTIGQQSQNPGTPLSAGGVLTLNATDIVDNGTLYAPFGQIVFNATKTLTLGDGSFTSVSGNGLIIPYGQTQFNGGQWVYADGNQALAGIPTRAVDLNGPTVNIGANATIDLTGGGDLFAYEFAPGAGGTRDQLAPNATTLPGTMSGLYAIVPSMRGQAAPQDPLYATSESIQSAQTVYLSGGAGLEAGFYPLLPARYALVPGAYLIKVESGMVSTTPGSLGTLQDGAPVVAGYLSYGSTGLHQTPGYTGFAIYPGTYGGKLAEYDVSLASTFYSEAATLAGKPRPNLPVDAGSLSINVGSILNASGTVRTAAATGGVAASIEVSARDLVLGSASGSVPDDAVSIDGAVLASWHPGSLLLGGKASETDDGTAIAVLADSVTIGAGTSLTADQIIVVANQTVDVQNGAKLQTTSAANGSAPAKAPTVKSVSFTDGSGATTGAGLLALSDLNWLIPTAASSSGPATVAVESGSTLASRGSLSISGPAKTALEGSLSVSGAKVSLSASSMAFVPEGTQADALSIGAPLLAQLGTAGDVRLASSGAIDFMTPTTLGVDANGNPTLKSLTLIAESLNNQTPSGSSATQLGAQTLVLQGVSSNSVTANTGPAGTKLSLIANELDIGPNALAVTGFAQTQANVSGAVIGKGTGVLNVGGDLTVSAVGVTVDAAADTTIASGGSLTVTASNGSTAAVPVLLGGALSLSGSSVNIAGAVTAPSGIIKVTSGGGGVSIDSGATLSTAGRTVSIQNQSVGTPGGVILVNAGAGNLTLGSGVTLDVSGAGTGDGGTLDLVAGGSASIAATLKGAGGTGAAGGSFSLNVGSLSPGSGGNPLTSLASSLTSGGFRSSIDVRARTGDLSLDSGSSLSANSVTLTADSGFLSIGGQIAASSGDLRGNISLFGGQGVELQSGATLHADGTGSSGRGGTIEIGAGKLVADAAGVLSSYNDAVIRLDQGSTISATGEASKGTLLLRAPALQASNDVAIGAIGSDISRLGAVAIEPVLAFTVDSTSVPTSAPQSVVDYIAAARGNIAAKMPAGSAVPLLVEAGVELIASGTGPLVLPALDLSPWNVAVGSPIDLTVRAAGDLQASGTISDGFSTASGQLTLTSGLSSSIRLVSGADLSSANPLAAIDGIGTLDLAPGAIVRTGTGDIDLIAGQNINVGAGAQAYTAGVPAIAPGGDSSNPYPIPAVYGSPNSDNSGIIVTGTNLLMSFPANGGSLTVRAGNDIVGSTLSTSDSSALAGPNVADWQLREGGNSTIEALPMWGVNLQSYDWNFGTLGGGDIKVAAGHDASNVTAAAADSLLPQYGGATQYVTSGGLSLTAGHDIGSAQVFLADGHGTVRAGGALTSVLDDPSNSTSPKLGSAFYLQNSSFDVTARLGITADGVFNPTTLPQLGVSSNNRPTSGAYLSYSDDASLSLKSIAGDIELGENGNAAFVLLGIAAGTKISSIFNGILPSSLSVQALHGSIQLDGGIGRGGTMILAPSPQGQLDLLAAGNISSVAGQGGGNIRMSDAKSGTYASVTSPFAKGPVDVAFSGDLHGSDTAYALIAAGGNLDNLTLSIPKAAQIVAGNDINFLTFTGQNLNDTDITLLSAGRDIAYPLGGASNGISVGGPGELEVLAGRNITLGNAEGIATSGNLLNPNLPSAQGANITVVTGLGGTQPDFAGFLASVIGPSSAYQGELIDYVETLQPKLSGLSFADAKAAFQKLAPEQQRPLIDQVFFHELLLSGRAGSSAGFKQGYAAIDALFPGSRTDSSGAVDGAYAGDLTLTSSKIYTLSGGDINLVVPGGFKSQPPAGLVDVGLANPPPTLGTKDPSRLGIVAEGPGNVNIYSKKDVNVNASRIFTLGGGNILIWSDEGNIDAGRGAKAAISAPPPTILINDDGSVQQNFAGAVAGSGIRTIQTNPKDAKGSVDLIAPIGVIDAGDAGIGAAGDINLASRSVIGVDNISFGGNATGVPAEVSNLGASLSGASSAGSGATANAANAEAAQRAAEQASNAPLSQTVLSWLDVFVTGLGEENCKPDDLDCMKRQKTNVN